MAIQSYSLDEFARLNDIALTTVYGEIRSGRLIARKIGRRTIITAEDANDWRDRLPKVQPRIGKSTDGADETSISAAVAP
jgi:Helix-turn-helix domain